MSKVYIKGKLRPMDTHKTLEKNCEMVLLGFGLDGISNKDTFEKQISGCYNFESFPFIVINKALYKIIERDDNLPAEFGVFEASRNGDDTIDFEIKYDTNDLFFISAIEKALEQGS